MRNKQKGFSLIELLIVVAIILIIAAIAIPNLLRSKMAANEASAVASLRTYNTSIVAYQTTYATDPTTDFAQLGPVSGGGSPSASAADLVDSLLGITGSPTKSGYTFTYAPIGSAPITQYTILAVPSVHLHRSAQVLHRPERRDSSDHGQLDADRYQHPDWWIMS